MQSSLTAPGTTETVRAASALVVAPHYDDEVLGCGGLVAQLTAAGAAAENYPFCTIDPNIGIVPVPDKRLDALVRVCAVAAIAIAGIASARPI